MRRLLPILLLIGILTGCGSAHKGMDRALNLRSSLLNGKGCTFNAVVTADYSERISTFTMKNTADQNGDLTFEVVSPDSIAGVTGKIRNEKGELTFDDEVLAFSLLADDQITPVSAPWLFIKTLRSGYIRACMDTDSGIRIQLDDSYDDDSLQIEIWTDSKNIPVRCEMLFRGRRIITLDVENFTIL